MILPNFIEIFKSMLILCLIISLLLEKLLTDETKHELRISPESYSFMCIT